MAGEVKSITAFDAFKSTQDTIIAMRGIAYALERIGLPIAEEMHGYLNELVEAIDTMERGAIEQSQLAVQRADEHSRNLVKTALTAANPINEK